MLKPSTIGLSASIPVDRTFQFLKHMRSIILVCAILLFLIEKQQYLFSTIIVVLWVYEQHVFKFCSDNIQTWKKITVYYVY